MVLRLTTRFFFPSMSLCLVGVFLALFVYTPLAQAAGQCQRFLREPLRPRQTAPAFTRTWTQYQAHNTNLRFLLEHLQATKAHLDALGVEYRTAGRKIIITPSAATEINQLADRVFKRHDILTFYDPQVLAQRGCLACVEYSPLSLTLNLLNVSHEALRTGRLTPSEFHEWRHIVEISKYTQDRNTPRLSGELRTLQQRETGQPRILEQFTLEEFFTYYTESNTVLALYRQGKISENAARLLLKQNFHFLEYYAADLIEHVGVAQNTIYRSFKDNGIPKLFETLVYDHENLNVTKGGLGFDFTPISNEKYRVRLRLITNDFDFVMMLSEPVSFNHIGRHSLPILTLAEFESLAQKAYSQILDVNIGLIDLYEMISRPLNSLEDYQQRLNDYRLYIQAYQ